MQTIEYQGRTFVDCGESRHCISQIEWATKILASPAVIYQNGKDSHVAAGQVFDKAEDKLISYLCIVAQ